MAIFNNGYPMSYNPPVQYQTPAIQQPLMSSMQPNLNPQQQYSDIIFVQGKEAAKVYPVAKGSSVTLFDSEGDKFYVKTVDNSGMPMKIRTFSYVEVLDDEPHGTSSLAPPEIDISQFVTKAEMKTVVDTVDTLANKIQNMGKQRVIEDKKPNPNQQKQEGK